MKNTIGGLDGWRMQELNALPLRIWELRYLVEKLADEQCILPTSFQFVSNPMLPKGHGGTALDHRGLSVFSGLYRVLSGAWWHQLTDWQEQWAHPSLHGGRRNRDIVGLTWEAQGDIERARVLGKPICGTLLDYTKFFDLFDHDFIFSLMEEMGYPASSAKQLRHLYTR